jgi:lipopolysaccharide/colanic/teichoic acid biosynthesis glycosyltransferase
MNAQGHNDIIGYRGKRLLDLALTISALIVLSPVLTVVAALVALWTGRPLIFTQVRPGLQTTPFTVYKFRTMMEAYDREGEPLPDRDRLTALGCFLRATSLDELPELFNVLKGEMSLVGPRPLFTKYLPYYSKQEMSRFTVRPGITGWAQINGRNDLAWDQRLACDVWYVEHCSLWLDLRILWSTVFKVLRRANVQLDTSVIEGDLSVERAGNDTRAARSMGERS